MDLADSSVGQLLIPVENLDRAIAFYRGEIPPDTAHPGTGS